MSATKAGTHREIRAANEASPVLPRLQGGGRGVHGGGAPWSIGQPPHRIGHSRADHSSPLVLPPMQQQAYESDIADQEVAAYLAHDANAWLGAEDDWVHGTFGRGRAESFAWKPSQPTVPQPAFRRRGGGQRRGQRHRLRQGARSPHRGVDSPAFQLGGRQSKAQMITTSGDSFSQTQTTEGLYTAYGDLTKSRQMFRKNAESPWRKSPSPVRGFLPGQIPCQTESSWFAGRNSPAAEFRGMTSPSPTSRTPLPAATADGFFDVASPSNGPQATNVALTTLRESVESVLDASARKPGACELPDSHRVIWRGDTLVEAAEERIREALEMARHRRDKVREAGVSQRRQAQEHQRRVRLKEKEAASLKKKYQPSEIQMQRRRAKSSTVTSETNYTEHIAANNEPTSPPPEAAPNSQGPSLGNMFFEMLSPRQVAQLDELRGQAEEPRAVTPEEKPSVLTKMKHNHSKEERFHQLHDLHKDRKRQERLKRLLDARRREFEAKPVAEQAALRKAFDNSAVANKETLTSSKELKKALEELGLAPKTDTEKKEVRLICDEVRVLGDVDFFAFAFDAVSRTRDKLREMRRGPLLQHFKLCDDDSSGYLCREECEQIFDRLYTHGLDDKGLRMMKESFEKTFREVAHACSGQVDFEGFETLMTLAQENYQRIMIEREGEIMEEENLSKEDVAEHFDELVSLYDSFTRGNMDGDVGMDKEELRVLLIEYGLYPRAANGQEQVEEFFHSVDDDGDGSLIFTEFLEVIRRVRDVFKLSSEPELRRMFEQTDKDASGLLDMAEVSALLGNLGLTPKCQEDQQEMKRILDGIDSDGNGVNFPEFQTLVQRISERTNAAQRKRERQSALELRYKDTEVAELRDAFYALDTEGKGILCIEKLRRVLDLLRREMSAESLQQIVERMDTDNVGGLGFQQFLHFMKEIKG